MMDEKIIYDLECSLLNPEVRQSKDLLDTYIADEFIEFGSSGTIYNKADTINSLPIEKQRTIDVLNFQINALAENVILATYVSLENGSSTLRSSIWRNTNAHWEMVFHQGTKVVE
jgi:hypothetical protein